MKQNICKNITPGVDYNRGIFLYIYCSMNEAYSAYP